MYFNSADPWWLVRQGHKNISLELAASNMRQKVDSHLCRLQGHAQKIQSAHTHVASCVDESNATNKQVKEHINASFEGYASWPRQSGCFECVCASTFIALRLSHVFISCRRFFVCFVTNSVLCGALAVCTQHSRSGVRSCWLHATCSLSSKCGAFKNSTCTFNPT